MYFKISDEEIDLFYRKWSDSMAVEYDSNQLLSMYCDLSEAQKEEFLTAIQNGGRVSLVIPDFSEENRDNALVIIQDPAPQNANFTIVSSADDLDGGTWTITFKGETTTALAWDVESFALQIALSSLSNVSDNAIQVQGGPFNDVGFILTFTQEWAETPIPEEDVTADDSLLEGPSDPYTLTVNLLSPGIVGGPKSLGWGQPWD